MVCAKNIRGIFIRRAVGTVLARGAWNSGYEKRKRSPVRRSRVRVRVVVVLVALSRARSPRSSVAWKLVVVARDVDGVVWVWVVYLMCPPQVLHQHSNHSNYLKQSRVEF